MMSTRTSVEMRMMPRLSSRVAAAVPGAVELRTNLLTFSTLYAGTLAIATLTLSDVPVASSALLAIPMIWLSTVDKCHLIIPDSSVVAIGAIGLVRQIAREPGTAILLIPFALAVLMAGWAMGEIYYCRTGRDGFGTGDAKLMAAGSICVGPLNLWLAVFLAATGGILSAIIRSRNLAPSRQTPVPFGPFLAYGFFLVHLTSAAESP